MRKTHPFLSVAMAMTALGLAAGSASAVTIDDDFESYQTGQTLGSQSDLFISTATVIQDANDPVNSTQVITQSGVGTQTIPLDLVGQIEYQLDLNISGDTGHTQLYLFGEVGGSDRPLWVQFQHDVASGHRVVVGQLGTAANWPELAEFETEKWYRITATLSVDPENGSSTRLTDIAMYELEDGGVLGDQVGHLTNLNPRGNATIIKAASIANSEGTSGRYDNFRVIPEPGSLGLLTLGGLLVLGRRRTE